MKVHVSGEDISFLFQNISYLVTDICSSSSSKSVYCEKHGNYFSH